MVVLRGHDRLDGTAQAGMSDKLWAEHTAELRRAYEKDYGASSMFAPRFSTYCEAFADGSSQTAAMAQHALELAARPTPLQKARSSDHAQLSAAQEAAARLQSDTESSDEEAPEGAGAAGAGAGSASS